MIKENFYLTSNEQKYIKPVTGTIENIYVEANHYLNVVTESKKTVAAIQSATTKDFPIIVQLDKVLYHYKQDALLSVPYNEHLLRGLPDNISHDDFLNLIKNLYTKNSPFLQQPPHNNYSNYHIPPIIHQIWFGSSLPLTFQKIRKKWRKIHPEWKLITWTEQNLPQHFPTGLENQAYLNHGKQIGCFAKMADVARYEFV